MDMRTEKPSEQFVLNENFCLLLNGIAKQVVFGCLTTIGIKIENER